VSGEPELKEKLVTLKKNIEKRWRDDVKKHKEQE